MKNSRAFAEQSGLSALKGPADQPDNGLKQCKETHSSEEANQPTCIRVKSK